MRDAYSVAKVRAAEAALFAAVPEGALMQRAAAGLASVCAGLLRDTGGVYGARVVILAGTGDNGGDALYAGERLARRGASVTVVQAGARMHAAGWLALRAAGGRVITVAPPRDPDATRVDLGGPANQPGNQRSYTEEPYNLRQLPEESQRIPRFRLHTETERKAANPSAGRWPNPHTGLLQIHLEREQLPERW